MNPKSDQHYLVTLLGPWVGLADDDEAIEKYRNVDGNCETEIKFHNRSDLGPWLAAQSPEDRSQMKRSIQELLHDTDFDFGGVFDDLLPPFEHPIPYPCTAAHRRVRVVSMV